MGLPVRFRDANNAPSKFIYLSLFLFLFNQMYIMATTFLLCRKNFPTSKWFTLTVIIKNACDYVSRSYLLIFTTIWTNLYS